MALYQVIRLDDIAYSAFFNDSVATYHCPCSMKFYFFLGSIQFIQVFLSFMQDQMEWVRRMDNIKANAEEIVYRNIIYM